MNKDIVKMVLLLFDTTKNKCNLRIRNIKSSQFKEDQMPETEVRLNQPARAFFPVRNILGIIVGLRPGGVLVPGSPMKIDDEPMEVSFDHGNRTIIFFALEDGQMVTLWRELSNQNRREVREIFPDNPLLRERMG